MIQFDFFVWLQTAITNESNVAKLHFFVVFLTRYKIIGTFFKEIKCATLPLAITFAEHHKEFNFIFSWKTESLNTKISETMLIWMNSVSPVCHAVRVCCLSYGDMNLIRFGQKPERKTRTHSDCIRNEKRYRIKMWYSLCELCGYWYWLNAAQKVSNLSSEMAKQAHVQTDRFIYLVKSLRDRVCSAMGNKSANHAGRQAGRQAYFGPCIYVHILRYGLHIHVRSNSIQSNSIQSIGFAFDWHTKRQSTYCKRFTRTSFWSLLCFWM